MLGTLGSRPSFPASSSILLFNAEYVDTISCNYRAIACVGYVRTEKTFRAAVEQAPVTVEASLALKSSISYYDFLWYIMCAPCQSFFHVIDPWKLVARKPATTQKAQYSATVFQRHRLANLGLCNGKGEDATIYPSIGIDGIVFASPDAD